MTKLFKWLAAAACALPMAAMAVTTTGYEDFGDTAGVVLWRGTQNDFHASTVADVAADGTVGEEYTMNTSGHPWQVFARGQSAYTSPGKVLVYDTPGTGDGYKYNADSSFSPLSFGGMWVKTLAINGQPFSILGTNAGKRLTEFGASDKSTLFRFDASYTINRTATTTFYGDATVEIAQGATFTPQADSNYGVAIDSAATLKLKGAGTLAVTTMNVAGTLDLSAATVPTISGNVAFAGNATLVLPAGTNPTTEAPLTVCSGTLSTDGVVYVKVGDAEPVGAELTINGGAITGIDTGIQTEQTFTSDYPSVVPAGYTYTYEATEAVTIPAVTVNGTLKTSGPITITDLDIANGADFEVVAGNTTVNCSADCKLKGNIKVDAGATLTNTRTDSLSYNHSMTVDIYGTLAMGTTRWSVPGGCTFKLHAGAAVTGAGDSLASLDFISGASKGLDVYAGEGTGSATIEGKVRVRANETRIWIAENTKLVLSSGICDGSGHHAGFKQVGPGTLEIHANSVGLSGSDSIMTQGTLRVVDTTLAFPVALQGNSSYLEVVATEASTTVPVNVTSIANNNVTFSGAGKVNGSIAKTSAPGGDLATALQSSAWAGTFVADWAGAKGTQFDVNSYGNADSVVEVTKLAGGYVSGSNANITVVPTVKVSGTMLLDNGYSGKVTTLTKLTGSGVFSNQTYSVDITTLDNFTGTLVPLISSQYVGMKIGTINLTAAPAAGDKIVNLGEGANIGQIANTKVSVNGVTDESFTGKLEVKSDGIYVKSTVTITVPAVANATVTVAIGEDTIGTEAGNYEVAPGSVVKVTYEAAEGYAISGTTEYTIDTASATTFDPSESTQVAAAVAYIGTTPYSDLATAFAAVDDDDTLTLVGTAVTLNSDVTVAKSFTLAGDAQGTAVTGSGKFYLTGSAEITLDATVTVGNQFVFQSADAELTFPSDKTPASVRPLSGYTGGTRDNEDGTKTYYMYRFLMLSVGGSNVTFTYAEGSTTNGAPVESGTAVVAQQVDEGDKLVFTATPLEGYTDLVVTCNGETVTPVDGKYTVVVGTVNVAIQATVTAGPTVAQIGEDEYPSIAAAFANATSGQTIKVLCDNTSNVRSVRVKEGATVTLDLNGCTVTGPSGDNPMFWLEDNSNFVVTDTTEDKAGKLVSEASKVVWSNNRCTFTLTAGTLESTTSVPIYIYYKDGAQGSRTVNINGGRLVSNSTSSSALDYCVMNASGTVNMRAGEIVSACGGFGGLTVNVSGGTVTVGTDNAIFRSGSASITVTGGTFNKTFAEAYLASGYEILNNGDGTYTVRKDNGWMYAAPGHWDYTGTWSEGAALGDDKVTISDGATYSNRTASAGQLVTLDMTMSFDGINDDEDDLGNAKAAIRLGEGETEGTYMFQLYTSESSTSTWKNATGFAPTVNTDYKIVFELDLSRKTYTAGVVVGTTTNELSVGGSTAIAFAYQGEPTPVQAIDFVGSGSVTSIEGSYGAAPPIGFVEDQEIGDVTLTSAQAAWLNGQSNYDALAAKIAKMTATAFNDAYLLNLDVLSEQYDGTYTFDVTGIAIGAVELDVGEAEPLQVPNAVTVNVRLLRKGALNGGINGTLKLKGGNSLPASTFVNLGGEGVVIDDATFKDGDETTIIFEKDSENDAAFYQPVIAEPVN